MKSLRAAAPLPARLALRPLLRVALCAALVAMGMPVAPARAQAITEAATGRAPASAPAATTRNLAPEPRRTANGAISSAAGSSRGGLGPVAQGRPISLYSGEIQVMDLPNVTRIAVGSGSVLRAQAIDTRQVVLIGEQPGTTSLHLWQEGGGQQRHEVTVRVDNAARIANDVQSLLLEEPELRVRTLGGRVVIDGDFSNPRTAERLAVVTKMYPQVVNLVAPRPPQPRVFQEKTILMDVRVVEVRKRALERLGIKWVESASGPTFLTSGYWSANTPFRGPPLDASVPGSAPTPDRRFATFFGIATDITSILNFLEQGGDSWTLAEPKLTCKSGGEAKFVVGGEIPIPVAAGLGQVNVVYKQYGVILEFKPVADADGNVSSRILAEVSEPDTRNSNQGFVAFTQNRTETEVTLRDNETLVISGLLKHRGTKSVDGIPGLGRIPILGALFRSKEFINEKTELVVMVTPRVVTPQSELNTAAIGRANQRADEVNAAIGRYMVD